MPVTLVLYVGFLATFYLTLLVEPASPAPWRKHRNATNTSTGMSTTIDPAGGVGAAADLGARAVGQDVPQGTVQPERYLARRGRGNDPSRAGPGRESDTSVRRYGGRARLLPGQARKVSRFFFFHVWRSCGDRRRGAGVRVRESWVGVSTKPMLCTRAVAFSVFRSW